MPQTLSRTFLPGTWQGIIVYITFKIHTSYCLLIHLLI